MSEISNERRARLNLLHLSGTESKVFDPRDRSTDSDGGELCDASIAKRNDQWWMYVAGQAHGSGATEIYCACLPAGEPLAPSRWKVIRNSAGDLEPIAGRSLSVRWDGKGGRHCPSYVRGWDPEKNVWVERIYYAGAAENIWGPYTIGHLEWNGEYWQDQEEPVFVAGEEWEHGSVYEPNVIYHGGKWKMWYVAGSNHENYLVHGYSESENGCTDWSKHKVFAPPEMKMFDFCVCKRGETFDAVFARVWMGAGTPPSETGLWWCRSAAPSGSLTDWSQPIQIMTAEDHGWHSGPWKPSLQFEGPVSERALVFFNGSYRTADPGPFPFVFTLGCLEIDLHADAVSDVRGSIRGSEPELIHVKE
jgi:hypothetical protein